MEKKNRYRNRIRFVTVLRLFFVVALLGTVGVAFVTIRNRHVLKGEEIRKAEVKIEALSQEIEMWELRIAGVKDRNELQRRLRWVGSNLEEIKAENVLRIQAASPEQSGKMAGIF